jgi:hypothetical protein
MNKLLLTILLVLPILSFAQDNKKQLEDSLKKGRYGTPIGWRIKEGDTLRLGIGSMPDHKFAFIYRSPVNAMKILAASFGGTTGVHETSDDNYNKVYLGSDQARQAIVKSIFINGTKRGGYTMMAKVGIGDLSNYWIELDNAIQASEILAPGAFGIKQKNNNIQNNTATTIINQATAPDKFDQLKKLKGLLDAGAITQTEYDDQKKKLLDQ